MAEGLTLTVSVKDIDVFIKLCDIMADVCKNERIPENIRQEILDRMYDAGVIKERLNINKRG